MAITEATRTAFTVQPQAASNWQLAISQTNPKTNCNPKINPDSICVRLRSSAAEIGDRA